MKLKFFFTPLFLLAGCTSHEVVTKPVESRLPAESSAEQDILSLKGKWITLIEISNINLNGKKYYFQGSCNKEQIKLSIGNFITKFGEEEGSYVRTENSCLKISFNVMQIAPKNNHQATVRLGLANGQIAGYFSSEETTIKMVDAVIIDAECSIQSFYKNSAGGFVEYLKTSEISPSERHLVCYLPHSGGKLSYKISE